MEARRVAWCVKCQVFGVYVCSRGEGKGENGRGERGEEDLCGVSIYIVDLIMLWS